MTATAIEDDVRLDEPAGDAVLGWLEEARTVFGWLAAGDGSADGATRIQRIAAFEKIKAAAAAAQLAEVVRFARSQVAEQHDAGVHYRRLGKGIGDQIGMATKAGPWHGARRQQPAEVHGFGPIPAGLADQIIGRTSGSRWWRRLFTARTSDGRDRTIVGGDPAARRFTGWLDKLIVLRDRSCREPFCTAPNRHVDHIVPFRDGGPTSYDNGRGVCEQHNYLREMPGWQVQLSQRDRRTAHHHHDHADRAALPQPGPNPP